MDCRPGLGELSHVYGPRHPTPSTQSTCGNVTTTLSHVKIGIIMTL